MQISNAQFAALSKQANYSIHACAASLGSTAGGIAYGFLAYLLLQFTLQGLKPSLPLVHLIGLLIWAIAALASIERSADAQAYRLSYSNASALDSSGLTISAGNLRQNPDELEDGSAKADKRKS